MSSTVSTSTGTSLNLQYADPTGAFHNLALPFWMVNPNIGPRTNTPARVLFIEDFRRAVMGMFNDGIGSVHRDSEINFGGLPTARLDPQGNTTANVNPGSGGPDQSGIVFKRRIVDNFAQVWGLEYWLRLTSSNIVANGNFMTSCSIYNRDGTNWWGARVWIDPSDAGGNLSVKTLNSAGTYDQQIFYAQNTSTHTYHLDLGTADTAGTWFYVKLVADMVNKKYVSVQFADKLVTFATTYPLRSTPDTGPMSLHFSIECAQKSSVRRYVNVAQVVGTVEG